MKKICATFWQLVIAKYSLILTGGRGFHIWHRNSVNIGRYSENLQKLKDGTMPQQRHKGSLTSKVYPPTLPTTINITLFTQSGDETLCSEIHKFICLYGRRNCHSSGRNL
jgi:hypothetical protein